MTFETLAAFTLQSTAVALAALILEGFQPKDAVYGRRVLWWLVWVGGIIAPLAEAFALAGGVKPNRDGYAVVFAIDSISASAPAQARVAAVWAVGLGALLLASWRILGFVRLRSYVANSKPLAPNRELAGEIALLEDRIRAKADYRISGAVVGPLMCGWLRPVVLLPEGFEGMPSGERLGILAHELAHVRRLDWLKLLLEEALRCLLWFTPAVHIASRRGRVAREMRADALAVGVIPDRNAYLNALVEIARRPVRADVLVAPLFLEPRSLKQRVAALLEERPMSQTRRIVAMMAAISLLPLAGRWAQDAFPARLQAAQGTVHKVGGDVSAPRLLSKVEPQYTDEARDAGLEGTVKLSIEVHPDGRAYNIQISQGLGSGLDEQAALAIEQWTFAPATRAGQAVTVAATVEVNFKLMDDPGPDSTEKP